MSRLYAMSTSGGSSNSVHPVEICASSGCPCSPVGGGDNSGGSGSSTQGSGSDTDGTVWEFHDFNSATPGRLTKVTNPGGQTLTLSYDTSGRPELMARIISDGSAAQAVRYSYSGAATHIAAAVQQRWDAASGIWVDHRKVEYSYYASSANGMDGDLEKATRYVLNDAGAWTIHSTFYYRYYKTGGGTHGLKYVVGPESYQRMDVTLTPETATDAQVAAPPVESQAPNSVATRSGPPRKQCSRSNGCCDVRRASSPLLNSLVSSNSRKGTQVPMGPWSLAMTSWNSFSSGSRRH